MAGRKPGSPKTGGRKKGSVNVSTADIKAIAQQYGAEAIEALVNIMRTSESDAAVAAASNSLLDRGYGKPKQELDLQGTLRAEIGAIRRYTIDGDGSQAA